MRTPSFRELLHRPTHLLAFGFGSGLSRFAPGTVGTLVGVGGVLLSGSLSLPMYLLTTVAGMLLGVWVCEVTARDLDVHDHPGIVWDEVVGFFVTMTALPRQWPWIVAGFVIFRLLDILKPFPINKIDQQVGGGVGIMLDDIVAGIVACGLLHLAFFLL